jgi:hypothetical protein
MHDLVDVQSCIFVEKIISEILLFIFSSLFSGDALERKSENTEIAWPKNADPKMLREPA